MLPKANKSLAISLSQDFFIYLSLNYMFINFMPKNYSVFSSKNTVSPGIKGGVENNIISTGVSPILSNS